MAAAGAGRRAVVLGRVAAGVCRSGSVHRPCAGRAQAAVRHVGHRQPSAGAGGRAHPSPRRRPGTGAVPVTAAVQAPEFDPAAALAEGRAVGRVVALASGLLMLLDEHGITGRLPLDARAQTSRLRHAVKLAVQTAATTMAAPAPARPDRAGELGAWLAAQPWAKPDPGPLGWAY